MLFDSCCTYGSIQICGETGDIHTEIGCITNQVIAVEKLLVLKQVVVHFPEAPLRRGGFGGEGS